MKSVDFTISQKVLNKLLQDFPRDGKNSDIGKMAIEIVKLYFISIENKVKFESGKNGADITVISKGKRINFEVKGTQDSNIAFSKLKVSGQPSYNALVSGMELIRVTNIRTRQMRLHFMKYGEDFTLVKEPRWAVKKI